MKPSVFNPISIRLRLIRLNTSFSLQESLAYAGNNWGSLLSTLSYTLTFVVFLKILFGRIDEFAGYVYQDMLFFTMIGQIGYYTSWIWSLNNIVRLNQLVNTGSLDLILTKPMPHLWFVTFRRIDLVKMLSTGFPSLIPILLLYLSISHHSFSLFSLLVGFLVFLCGQIMFHNLIFSVNLAVFWTEGGSGMERITYSLQEFAEDIPWEGLPFKLKAVGFVILPLLIQTALSVSFFLGKTTSIPLLGLIIFSTALSLCIKTYVWKMALLKYSSASS